jgi:hypothetical protein
MCCYARQAPAIQVATRQPAENGPMRDLGRLGGGLIGVLVTSTLGLMGSIWDMHGVNSQCVLTGGFIQELENAPTSIAMFLIEYAMEGRSPVLVITYQQDFSFLKGTAEGPKST